MNRLMSTVGLDVRLQARNNLYTIGIVVAALTGIIGRSFLGVTSVAALLPGLWLGAIGSTTFMFVAGMVLFEKGERTLDALIVTPLRIPTYMLSKVVTLTAFALVESLLVLFVAHGPGDVSFVPLVAGIVFLGVMYTLLAVAQVVAHTAVTDFLVPGGFLVLTVLQLPFLHAFGFWTHPALYVVPTQATVILMQGGFSPREPWQWAYGVGYSLMSIAAAAWLARRQFERHIVQKGAGA